MSAVVLHADHFVWMTFRKFERYLYTYFETMFYLFTLYFITNKTMDTEMDTMTPESFDELKKAYIDAIPAGDALKQQLKSHNKEQKARLNAIHAYMRENNIMSEDIGGITFEREEKTTVSVNMKTLEEIIENPADLEQYKRDHAKTKESLKVRKPKRQRTEE